MANAWTETARYETPVFDAEIIAHHPDRRIAGAYQCNPGSVVQSDGVTPSPVVYACNISSVGPVVPFSSETHKRRFVRIGSLARLMNAIEQADYELGTEHGFAGCTPVPTSDEWNAFYLAGYSAGRGTDWTPISR